MFHTKREGRRAWRVTESRVWKAQKKADDLWRPLQKPRQQGKSLAGKTQRAYTATFDAQCLLREAIQVETAWQHVCSALEWFTPDGQLNTVEAAREKLDEWWLPHLKGKAWEKTVRMLRRPGLAFLDRVGKQLESLPFQQTDVQDAL